MMEKINTIFLGYGEDALTLWAITERLELILDELGDDSDPAECTVFYRPSFGRRGLYGEFDAIIVTPMIAYLVESKWWGLLRPTKSTVKLKDNQILRHEILAWYHRNWKGEDWDEFVEENESSFREKFPGKHIPLSKTGGETTVLAQNLQTVLNFIKGRKLRNILIFFHRGELPKIETDFKIVEIEYETKLGNYIELLSTRGGE